MAIEISCFGVHRQLWGVIIPHAELLVKPVPSSTLFHPGEAAAGEEAVEKDHGIRTAAEEA
jgi:hypothetical protein